MELETKLGIKEIVDSKNVATLLSENDLSVIGAHVVQSYETDLQSRQAWETKMRTATDLALQIVQEKTTPWRGASNVKFPLLTIASLQFAARAYPALVKAPDIVKYRVQGKDDGQKAARGARISAHMSYQLLEQDEQWEEHQDRAFIALPILGCIFKKSYYSSNDGHNRSTLVLPKSLVVHYYAKSLEKCERKTEIIPLYQREIRERELKGIFIENEYGPAPYPEPEQSDKRQGTVQPPSDDDTPRDFLEQHCYLDLDGDGYKEPYVVTVDKATKKLARIVPRFANIVTEQSVKIEELTKRMREFAASIPAPEEGMRPSPEHVSQIRAAEATIREMQDEITKISEEKPKVLRIEGIEYYTKYSFIPSPDGGFYDLGFGALLGPLNDSVNTLINQLIDSGTLQNGSVGFIGKGARIKGGKVRFQPNEWKRVNVSGGVLRDSLVPLPINQPSSVLFQLLGLLVSYSERVGSVTEAMTGENVGQNTPAYNMNAMLEQGLQVFNGIFKRIYRSFRSELRKLYRLNAIYLEMEEYFAYQDSDLSVLKSDYSADPKDLIPAADPNAFSNTEKTMKAQAVAQRAQVTPGYDPIKVEQRLLEAMDIPDVNEIFPLVPEVNQETGEQTGGLTYKFPPQPNPEFEIKRAEEQRRTLEAQSRHDLRSRELEGKLAVNEAQVIKLMAEARLAEDAPELARLKLIAKQISDARNAAIEERKIDESGSNKEVA